MPAGGAVKLMTAHEHWLACPLSVLWKFDSAVCETPDDDAPRLVFADWLEDNGDEAERAWGEYIRLECEWEKLSADGRKARCRSMTSQDGNFPRSAATL